MTKMIRTHLVCRNDVFLSNSKCLINNEAKKSLWPVLLRRSIKF